MKRLFAFILLLACHAFSFAQDTTGQGSHAATGLRANGKIYVVMTVVLTILAGLFIYVIRLDRKITKLEKR